MIDGFLIAWREVKAIVLGLLALLFFALGRGQTWLVWLSAGLLGWVAYFFRDPERTPDQTGPHVILAPADGRITDVELVEEPFFIKGQACRISLFLSLFDVHVQRAPYQGQVQFLHYQPGSFAPAFLKDTQDNEYNLIGFDTPHGPIVVKQIAGILARRIVCWVQPDDEVAAGQRIGLIKFGSRVDLLLPPDVAVQVKIGEQIYGGQTVVAHWESEDKTG